MQPKTQLRLAREARGLTRARIAAAAGIAEGYYRRVEQLDHPLTPELALIFSRLLGAPISPAAKLQKSNAARAPRGSSLKPSAGTRTGRDESDPSPALLAHRQPRGVAR